MSGKDSGIKKIVRFLAYLITIVAAAALGLSLLSSVVEPESIWWLSILGLAAPVTIFVNILIAIFWVCKWKPIALVPIIVLTISSFDIADYFSISFLKSYPQNSKSSFRVASYNVMGFINNESRESGHTIDSIASFAKDNQIDILCLQEFRASASHNEQELSKNMAYYPFRAVKYIHKQGEGMGNALAIYSKHPIIESKTISSNRVMNGAMYADIVVKGDTIRVFNNHLQTSSIDIKDRAFVADSIVINNIDSTTIYKSKNIVLKLKDSYIMRQKQVDSLSLIIHSSPYPQIVCGDFNDVPISYAYNKMRGDLNDCFSERGNGYGYTFNEFMRMLRIDFILCSHKFEVITYDSPKLPYSDHNPVISLLEIKR